MTITAGITKLQTPEKSLKGNIWAFLMTKALLLSVYFFF